MLACFLYLLLKLRGHMNTALSKLSVKFIVPYFKHLGRQVVRDRLHILTPDLFYTECTGNSLSPCKCFS